MSLGAVSTLDELDRRIVVALQHDGRASWRSIAEMVDSSTATVARRGQQLLAAGVAKVVVMPALSSKRRVDLFVIRINCQPGSQLHVASQLVEHDSIRFVSLVTGSYDIIAELAIEGDAAHFPQLIEQLQSIAGIERWRSDLTMHIYKVTFDWGKQLFAETLNRDEAAPVLAAQANLSHCEPDHFDASDWAMLEALREDGRATFQAIGNLLGMNESSVRRRFERLRAQSCIDISTLVPAAALGMGAETLLTVKVTPSRMDAVARELAQHPAVRYLSATLDENSLFCEVIMPSTDALYEFITSTLSRLDGVEGWNASMELLSLKRGFVETPWWRSQVSAAPAVPRSEN